MSEHELPWFYADGDQKKGPFTRAQMEALISERVVRAETLVWTATQGGWLPLARTDLGALLDPTAAAIPPDLPQAANTSTGAAPPRGFVEAIRICFARYGQFAGRASRSEFWYFYLFGVIVSIASAAVDTAMWQRNGTGGFVQGIVFLATVLPSISVCVRRLHDTDRTGWWWWINLIPLIGQIVLAVFWCQRGTPGRNRYG